MKKIFTLFIILALSILVSAADSVILYQTKFGKIPKKAISGRLKTQITDIDKQRGKALSFVRNRNLNKGASSSFLVKLPDVSAQEKGFVQLSLLLNIGNRTPAKKGQVSSSTSIRITDKSTKKNINLIFSTKRYNRNRTITFFDGKKIKNIPLNFPVDKFLNIQLTLDENKNMWRATVEHNKLKLFDTEWIKVKTPFEASQVKIYFSTTNRNDGMLNSIADICIKKSANFIVDDTLKKNCSTKKRTYKIVNNNLYNSAFIDWSGDNLSDRVALSTPESAEKRAAELKSLGISCVLYNGRHFRSSYVEEFPLIRKAAQICSEACKKYGIEMIEHHEPTIVSYRAYPFLLSHLDWTQRDIRTGETSFWFCPNNKKFQNYYFSYLAAFQQDAKIAGFMIDELSYNNINFCACQSCRQKFKKDTNLNAPLFVDPKQPTALQLKFREWGRKQINDIKIKTAMLVKKYRSDSFLMLYCSDYTDPHSSLHDLTQSAAQLSSFIGWENMISNPLNSYRSMFRALKNRNSLGDFYNIPVWSLNRESFSKEAHYLSWAMCQAARNSIWYGRVDTVTEAGRAYFKKYNTWPKVMAHRYARYLTDVAVLFSQQTKDATKNRNFFWTDFSGIMDMFIINNRQYDVILDGNLFYPGYLKKYKTIFLPSQACLSETQCERLKNWVKNGGTAVITNKTSLYDENCMRRPDFKLAKAMNINYEGRKKANFEVKSKKISSNAKISSIDIVSIIDPSKSTIIAQAVAKDKSYPLVVSTKHGKGRFIYVAAQLGNYVYELEGRNQRKYRTKDKPEIEKLIISIYDFATNKKSPITITAPRKVVGIANQLMAGKDKGEIYVHLYNFTGKNIKYGEKSQYGVDENIKFPIINSNIKINVNIPCQSDAVFQSPMADKDIKISGVKNKGTMVFSIPGKILESYGHLKIKSKALPQMAITNPPIKTHAIKAPNVKPAEPDISKLYYPEKSLVKFVPSDNKKVLPLKFDNVTIVAKDAYDLSIRETSLIFEQQELKASKKMSFPNGNISCGKILKCNMPWVREISEDKEKIEITTAAILPPGDNKARTCSYVIYIPVASLKGANLKYYFGMHRSGRPMRSHTFTGQESEKKHFIASLRYGQFTGGPVDFMIDFSPEGIWGIFNEDQTTTYKAHVYRRGNYYIFRVASNRVRYGRKLANKIIFRKGIYNLDGIHPIRKINYRLNRPVDCRIQFGNGKGVTGFATSKSLAGFNMNFTMRQLQNYTAANGSGFIDSANAKIKKARGIKTNSIYAQGIFGTKKIIYRVDHANGVAILNIVLSGMAGAIKGNITVNDNIYPFIVKNKQVNTIAIPVMIKNKYIKFSLEGKYMLSGIVIQPIASAEEDYIFSRSFWKTGISPWKVLKDKDYNKDWKAWKTTPFQQAKLTVINNKGK